VRNGVRSSEPVRIEGQGISWYSVFGLENTIVPGTCRRVKESRSALEVYRIIFWQEGTYEVRTSAEESVQVEIREGTYLFGPPGQPAVAVTQKISEAEWIPQSKYEVTPYFRTIVYEDVNPAFLMMVLSFPALMFY